LKFAEKADRLPEGDYVTVDVMKLNFDEDQELGASRKLTSLVVSRQDLERSISHIQWPGQTSTHADEIPMEHQISAILDEAFGKFKQLSEDPYFRDAIMKAVIREACHRFVEFGVAGHDIADHLEVMAGVMRDSGPE
jgi:hypothetical protein